MQHLPAAAVAQAALILGSAAAAGPRQQADTASAAVAGWPQQKIQLNRKYSKTPLLYSTIRFWEQYWASQAKAAKPRGRHHDGVAMCTIT